MSVGDVIELSGKVSETQGKKRINLQKDSQIIFMEHWEIPEPDKFATGELSDDLIGSLIKVAGVLLEQGLIKNIPPYQKFFGGMKK